MASEPVIHTPDDQMFEPTQHCPEYWGDMVMGFCIGGYSPEAPVPGHNDDPKPDLISPNKE